MFDRLSFGVIHTGRSRALDDSMLDALRHTRLAWCL
ncbi:hypothetical protein BX604_5731 [Burkholderia sp. JKS000303]|nr:hypothetical protein BX604_5731 [Burkholderia sp. JKS000303]